MSKNMKIGPYSAYAIAVKYGYTGTEEQWVKEQESNRVSSGQAAQQAEQARGGAEAAAARAESAADRAESAQQATESAKTDALTAIGTSKQDALNSVQEAQSGAVKAVSAAETAATEAVQEAQDSATGAVSNAQATAVKAVDAKGKEALANISTGIDPTLSLSGKAADAKMTGDKIGELKEDTGELKKLSLRATQRTNLYSDMNDIPINSTATFVGANVANAPLTGKYSYTVLCFNHYVATNPYGGSVQIAIELSASNPRLWYRKAYSSPATWSSWMEVYNSIAVDKKISDLKYLFNETPTGEMTSLSCFQRIGVIGDSYASGWLNVSGTAKDWYNISWPQQLARLVGSTGINFSKGGLTTRTWLTSASGLKKLNSEDACDLYYVVLGINDVNTLGADYLGTIADCTGTPSENPDTFYGNMGKIFNAIQTKAPNAKIIFSTMASNTGDFLTFNNAIKEIALHFKVPYIVQNDDSFFTSSYYLNNKVGGHPTVQLYGGMAKSIERLTVKCMLNNISYFNDIYPTA